MEENFGNGKIWRIHWNNILAEENLVNSLHSRNKIYNNVAMLQNLGVISIRAVANASQHAIRAIKR